MLSIYTKHDYISLLSRFKEGKLGYHVGNTQEMVNVNLNFCISNFNHEFRGFINYEFFDALEHGSHGIFGSYNTDYYIQLAIEIERIRRLRGEQGIESRQFVINFPTNHCFTSVQFLFRDRTAHIICNMRSCNVKDNLINDAMLCYFLLEKFTMGIIKGYSIIDLTMNIGSLHMFK